MAMTITKIKWAFAVQLAIVILASFGYFMNIYKLTLLDFQAPYKAEAFRIAGVITSIGAVLGYVTFDEEKVERISDEIR